MLKVKINNIEKDESYIDKLIIVCIDNNEIYEFKIMIIIVGLLENELVEKIFDDFILWLYLLLLILLLFLFL